MKISTFLQELREAKEIARSKSGIDVGGLPPFHERLATFLKALTSHATGGFRKSTQEETADRLAICQACEQFDGDHCKVCGCGCSGDKVFLNKLAWASESCPLQKWGKIET